MATDGLLHVSWYPFINIKLLKPIRSSDKHRFHLRCPVFKWLVIWLIKAITVVVPLVATLGRNTLLHPLLHLTVSNAICNTWMNCEIESFLFFSEKSVAAGAWCELTLRLENIVHALQKWMFKTYLNARMDIFRAILKWHSRFFQHKMP